MKFAYFGGIDYKNTQTGTSFDLPDAVGSAQLKKQFNGCFRNIRMGNDNLPLDQLLKYNFRENLNYGMSLGCNVPCLGKCSGSGKCSKKENEVFGKNSIFELQKSGNQSPPKCLNGGRCIEG